MVALLSENMISPLHSCLAQSNAAIACGRMFEILKNEKNAKEYTDL